jgi:hypothetical protein
LALYFDHVRIKAKLTCRVSRGIALFARNRVECDSDSFGVGEHLARDLNPFGGELELANKNAGNVATGP